jgi:hypothetical protein
MYKHHTRRLQKRSWSQFYDDIARPDGWAFRGEPHAGWRLGDVFLHRMGTICTGTDREGRRAPACSSHSASSSRFGPMSG